MRMAMRKMTPLYEAWERFAALGAWPNEPETKDALRYRTLLTRAHEEYRQKFNDQEKLWQEGNFIREIASAFARMPTATRLEIRDDDKDSLQRKPTISVQAEDDEEAVVRATLLPVRWGEARLHNLGRPPVEAIV
jgi:hypothetical protein